MMAQTLDIHSDVCRDALSSVWNLFHHHLSSHGVKFGKQSVHNGHANRESIQYSNVLNHFTEYNADEIRLLVCILLLICGAGCRIICPSTVHIKKAAKTLRTKMRGHKPNDGTNIGHTF